MDVFNMFVIYRINMGITRDICQALFYGKSLGVSFEKTLMLGRLKFYMKVEDVEVNVKKYRNNVLPFDANDFSGAYSEPLFKLLGAKEIDSVDISGYENATILHDLNQPIDKKYHGRFSAIIDGGTLEHIFNYPVAVANCMKALRIGGHFIGVSPANNSMGHGFYQFSPELFYRTFNAANGFSVKFMGIVTDGKNGEMKWYQVADPDKVNSRVMLVNNFPLTLVVIAEKLAEQEIFKTPPQQADYVKRWDKFESISQNVKIEKESKARFFLRKLVPLRIKIILHNINDIFTKQKIKDPYLGIIDKEHFKEIDI